MKDQANIPVYKRQLLDWAALKAEAQRQAGRPLSWSQFMERVVAVYISSQGEAVTLRKEPERRQHGLDDLPLVPAEVGAVDVRPMTLSDRSCELIADKLAKKLGQSQRRRGKLE
ncbi:MAG: hypothetical protein Q7K03_01285 [Dehalococcoidia bacterium]|nr:hypothetical protein [Dehalococcoidia bacterium]